MKPIRIAAVAALVLAAAALAGVGLPEAARSQQGTATRGITVNATGQVEAAPDRAALELGVETQAPNAQSALAQNAERLNRVLAALRRAGVAKDDLQTSQVSLWPQRASDGTTVTGYQATNTVSAELGVEKAGAAIDAAVGAGANVVSGPALAVEERDALYRQALAKAVEAGRRQGRGRRRRRRRLGRPRDGRGGIGRLRAAAAVRVRGSSERRGCLGHADRARHAGDRGDRHGHVRVGIAPRPQKNLAFVRALLYRGMTHGPRDDCSDFFQRRRYARPYALAGAPFPPTPARSIAKQGGEPALIVPLPKGAASCTRRSTTPTQNATRAGSASSPTSAGGPRTRSSQPRSRVCAASGTGAPSLPTD